MLSTTSLKKQIPSSGTLAVALLVGSVAGGAAREINFDTTIKPVLQEHCFKCHGPKKQKGKLRLDTLSPDLVQNQDVAEAWYAVREALTLGEMAPEEETPDCSPCKWRASHE